MVVSGPRSPKHRLPGLLHVSFPGLEARRLVVLLERRGVSVGTGSACAASRMRESHVLHAMGLPPEVSAGSLRITMGRQTSMDDIDYAAAQIADAVRTEMRRTGLSQDDMLGRAGGLAVGRRR
jgi:cysteine desulfurase